MDNISKKIMSVFFILLDYLIFVCCELEQHNNNKVLLTIVMLINKVNS